LVDELDGHPGVFVDGRGVAGGGGVEGAEVFAADGFEVGDGDAEDAAGFEDAAALTDEAGAGVRVEVFEDVGVVDGVGGGVGEGERLADVERAHAGDEGREIEVLPGGVDAGAAAEVEEGGRHGGRGRDGEAKRRSDGATERRRDGGMEGWRAIDRFRGIADGWYSLTPSGLSAVG
jgi:hypothetical protein